MDKNDREDIEGSAGLGREEKSRKKGVCGKPFAKAPVSQGLSPSETVWFLIFIISFVCHSVSVPPGQPVQMRFLFSPPVFLFFSLSFFFLQSFQCLSGFANVTFAWEGGSGRGGTLNSVYLSDTCQSVIMVKKDPLMASDLRDRKLGRTTLVWLCVSTIRGGNLCKGDLSNSHKVQVRSRTSVLIKSVLVISSKFASSFLFFFFSWVL